MPSVCQLLLIKGIPALHGEVFLDRFGAEMIVATDIDFTKDILGALGNLNHQFIMAISELLHLVRANHHINKAIFLVVTDQSQKVGLELLFFKTPGTQEAGRLGFHPADELLILKTLIAQKGYLLDGNSFPSLTRKVMDTRFSGCICSMISISALPKPFLEYSAFNFR